MSLINGLSAMGESVAKTMAGLTLEERRGELEERRLALAYEMQRPERDRASDQWERKFASDESLRRAQETKLRSETDTLDSERVVSKSLFGGVFGGGGDTGIINKSGDGTNADRIKGIESSGKYDAIGPVANDKGQRAYGAYQVMDFNIGPWTKEVLGKELTPKEFLASPEAQDKVFEAKFGEYVKQYGSPEAASRAWFAGPGGMNNPNASDVNGMTVANYEKKFSGGTPPASAAPGGKIAPATEPLVGSDGPAQPGGQPPRSAGGPPTVPEVGRPQVTPEMVKRHMEKLQAGGYGLKPGDALKGRDAAIEKEIDDLWKTQREAAFKKYEQEYEGFKYERKKGDDDAKRDAFEVVSASEAQKALGDAYSPDAAYQKNIRTGKIELIGSREKKDTWAVLSPDKARERLGENFDPGVSYQENNRGEIKVLGPKGMNNEQARDAGFADRMANSNGLLRTLDKQGMSVWGRLSDKAGSAGNIVQKEEYQLFKQAKDDFINAQLRRESGAAISADEYQKADRQYFPMPGDSQKVLEQKALNRAITVQAMIRGAGPSYKPSANVGSTGGPTPDRGPSSEAPTSSSSGALPSPDKREFGQVYSTPKGPHIWMGTGWAPVPTVERE